MTTRTDTAATLLILEGQFRAAMQGRWPTPQRRPATMFALSEVGETADAELRNDAQWVRNNARTPSQVQEVAQVGMMICTALLDPDPVVEYDTELCSLGVLARDIGLTLIALGDGRDGERELQRALSSWIIYAEFFGHPVDLLNDEHKRLAAKHGGHDDER